MTDDDKALVERLREGVLYGDARLHNPKGHDPLRMEAADRIEALSAEVEKFSGLARLAILKAYDTDKALSAENEQLCRNIAMLVDAGDEMAKAVEALIAEGERLREALEWYVAEDAKYMRAALGDTK